MYNDLKQAINNLLQDNTQGLITPENLRQIFSNLIDIVGAGSNFMGYAPLTNPTATPAGKRWYFTDPDLVSSSQKTYTGYGSAKVVKVGMMYVVWWDETAWHWTVVERDFQNAYYGTNGNVVITIPPSVDPPTPTNPRVVPIINDGDLVSRVARMRVDGVDVPVTASVNFTDANEHTVSVELDNTYTDGTPDLFSGIGTSLIRMPYGVASFDQPLGTTDTEVILPPTVTSIDASAITDENAQSIVLTGAPPTLDSEIDWSNVQSLTLPKAYVMLYSNDETWRNAIDDIREGGGTVNLDDGSEYTDAREQIDVTLTSQTVFASDEWVVSSDTSAKEVCEAIAEERSVNPVFESDTLIPSRVMPLSVVETSHKHYGKGSHVYDIVENEPPNVSVMSNLVVIRQDGETDRIKATIKDFNYGSYYIYDANGTALYKGSIRDGICTADFSQYQPGEYRLQLIEQKGAEKNYDITKNEALSNDIDEYSVLYKGKCQYDSDEYDEELLAVDHYFNHEEVYYDGELDTSDIEHFTVAQEQADWNETNNKKPGYIKNKPTLAAVATSGDFDDLTNVPLGEANGIAELDSNGRVPSSQLPSYVDDVIEGYLYNNHFYEDSAHTILSPADQESGKIFVDLQDNLSYRWSGSTYVEVSQSLALGETSSTAYRGDRGKTAYDHATDANRLTTAQSSALYKIAVTSEGHVASVTSVVASDIPTQDATETQKGVAELATSAEAITGTDTERVLTPKTNRDAHDAWHWFGTQAQFDALSPNYDANVIYHVEQGYTIPQPTVADAGKLLSVSALGDYELITIVNSELVEY